jgi:hypothetical protein
MAANEDLQHALSLMETALEVLDKADGALDVAAHLDLAIQRLKAVLGEEPSSQS